MYESHICMCICMVITYMYVWSSHIYHHHIHVCMVITLMCVCMVITYMCVCMVITNMYVSVCVFSSHSFWTSSSLDVPAGVTQGEGHTGFFTHLPSAVRAFLPGSNSRPNVSEGYEVTSELPGRPYACMYGHHTYQVCMYVCSSHICMYVLSSHILYV